jgi:uncharacterized membrane protein YeaQ/YmgE (transglycosylase-associated protein family)
MSSSSSPGLRWPLILGMAGFLAGFIGPLIFDSDANQGPLVGILMTGPGGAVLGLVLLGVCRLTAISARAQWRLLWWTATAGTLVTLLAVQPGPQLRGYVYEAKVSACSAPIDAEAQILADWRKRIADVTWSTPRAGWEQDIHATIANAPGVLVTIGDARRKSILAQRKPWNRGRISVTAWNDVNDEKSFHASRSACAEFPVGRKVTIFERYDLGGRIEAPKDWPPTETSAVLGVSPWSDVPPEYVGL